MVRIPPIPIPKKMAERYPCQEVDMISMRLELVARENAEIISASRMVILLTISPKTTPETADKNEKVAMIVAVVLVSICLSIRCGA